MLCMGLLMSILKGHEGTRSERRENRSVTYLPLPFLASGTNFGIARAGASSFRQGCQRCKFWCSERSAEVSRSERGGSEEIYGKLSLLEAGEIILTFVA